MSTDIEQQLKNELAEMIAGLKNPTDILSFMTLFLSDSELLILSRRLAIFKRLTLNKSYEEIQKELGVSSATVSSVAQLRNQSFAQHISKHITAQDWAEGAAKKLRTFFSKPSAEQA
ncbi:hypothetical protein KA082_01920 [Candidatus Woesebacteria bacterium]|nr:hypothetical protein [Candidatus Woesebacteria bacterium]